MPFPLIVELKLYFESMLEGLHWPHMECITFPSDQLQCCWKGPLLFFFIFFFLPEYWMFDNEKPVNKDQISSNKTTSVVRMTVHSGCFAVIFECSNLKIIVLFWSPCCL